MIFVSTLFQTLNSIYQNSSESIIIAPSMSGTFSLYQTILALIMKDIQINSYHQTCNILFIHKMFIDYFLYVDAYLYFFLFDSFIIVTHHVLTLIMIFCKTGKDVLAKWCSYSASALFIYKNSV